MKTSTGRWRLARWIACAAALTASGCAELNDGEGDEGQNNQRPPLFVQPSPLTLTAGVESFKDCSAVEAYIEDHLAADMERYVQQQISWLEHAAKSAVAQGDAAPAPAGGEGAAASAVPQSPSAHTGTNDQVVGVEEADFVKTDGRYTYQVAGGALQVLQSWPAESMLRIARLDLEGQPFRMLFDDASGRLVVLSHPALAADGNVDVGMPAMLSDAAYLPGMQSIDRAKTLVQVVDVRDPASPQVAARYEVSGAVMGARRIGSSVRLVLQSAFHYPEGVLWYPLETGFWDKPVEGRIAWYRAQLARNLELIRAQTLAGWLGNAGFARVDGAGRRPLVGAEACDRVHAPTTTAQAGLTRIGTLSLDAGEYSETVLLASASHIYASKDALVLATPYWWWDDASKDTDVTFLHAFDTTDQSGARYVGSGGVEGTLLDQFSMDEYQGVLRVATTVSRRTGDAQNGMWTTWETVNRVTTLAPRDGRLVELGRTPDLAPGERVFAARFYAERGFVVTFRQVDPLFTVDLSDPTAPRVVGELKVPGFSSYIHMLDAEHLVTVGRDADEMGRQQGLKISVFNVGDMAAPREVGSHVLDQSIWSEAQWDHLAFTYFPARGMLALPATAYRWGGGMTSALLLFKADAGGVAPAGELDMSDVRRVEGSQADVWSWWTTTARVSRAIFADDYVYAVSDLGVRAARLDALDRPVATVLY